MSTHASKLDHLHDEYLTQLVPWEKMLERHIDEWNKTHASVIVGGKHRIMRLVPGSATQFGRDTYEFISRHELNLVYANTAIKVGEKQLKSGTKDIFKTHLMAWAEDKRSRSYPGGVVFLPGRGSPKGCFNTWRGFSVEPIKDDSLLERIFYHMEAVVCGGDKDLYGYMIRWIAFTIQHPDRPAGAALVLRGEKGSGKGTIGRFLCDIWGNHSAHITNSRHLVGHFNGHLADVCFMFADEAFFSGDRQGENTLKGLVTEPTMNIERKGIDPQQQPNYLKIFMATNSDFAVPASRDERRFCVFDVSSKHIGDREYFKALSADCSSKAVQSAFLYYMLNVDLTDWHTGNIPESVGLRAQRYHSMDTVQKWLAQALIDGTFGYVYDETLGRPVDGHGWVSRLNTEELFNKYIEYCELGKHDQYRRKNKDQMSAYLGKIFKKANHINGRDRRGFVFGELETAIAEFEQYEKVKLSELWSV